MNLPKGQLTITGGSAIKPYIQSLKLNGEKFKSPWIDWSLIKEGGTLDFTTSKTPNRKWGKDTESPSYN